MPAHSRSKNGVASLAYVAGIHVLNTVPNKDVDGRNKSGHDELADVLYLPAPADVIRGEMVDARDLKSLGSNFPCRFKSGRPHQQNQ